MTRKAVGQSPSRVRPRRDSTRVDREPSIGLQGTESAIETNTACRMGPVEGKVATWKAKAEDGQSRHENAIQYEIAGLSKFMTIYTHCMLDAVGVRVVLTAFSLHASVVY